MSNATPTHYFSPTRSANSLAYNLSATLHSMKDISLSSSKHARAPLVYPKKRPSPHGVSKHKSPNRPPAPVPHGVARKSPRAHKLAALQAKQRDQTIKAMCRREAHLAALRRDGILLEEEYREEVQAYMHEMEATTMCSMQSMDQQPEIRWHMRPCLVDFLVEIHFTFRLRPETLYLTLNIIDRYVSRRIVYVKHYQLVGCAALWIAAKFEDAKDRVPSVQDLVSICRDTYEESAFIQMEGHVLSTIGWALGHPTAEAWLRLMCCDPFIEDMQVQHVARFLMEITLFYREFVKYPPSAISLAALTLARYICGQPRRIWEETVECLEVVDLLDNRLATRTSELSQTLVKKYSYAFYSKASMLVVSYYLAGKRWSAAPAIDLPVTPKRSSVTTLSTPASTTTTASDLSDDMPLTPTTPPFSDPFSPAYASDDKENVAATFEPLINKLHIESVPDQFLPHSYVAFRPALHNLNVSSPGTAMVS